MRLNKAARKALSKHGIDEHVLAVTQLGLHVGLASSHSGVSGSARTVFSLDYARARDLDVNSPSLRTDLVDSWVTLTPTQMLFHESNLYLPRQVPREPITTIARTGTTLSWFDQPAYGVTTRVLHFQFADSTELLAAAMYQAKLRRKPVNDELDLFVQAFEDAATSGMSG